MPLAHYQLKGKLPLSEISSRFRSPAFSLDVSHSSTDTAIGQDHNLRWCEVSKKLKIGEKGRLQRAFKTKIVFLTGLPEDKTSFIVLE